MNLNERKNLMAKIIADLQLLIAESWSVEITQPLEKALLILESNRELEGYDD